MLLKKLDNRFENIPEVILACCILHDICQQADKEILCRVIAIDREYLETRHQENIARIALCDQYVMY